MRVNLTKRAKVAASDGALAVGLGAASPALAAPVPTVQVPCSTGVLSSDYSGAIYGHDGPVSVTGGTFSGNYAGGDGGAIYNDSSLTVTGAAARNSGPREKREDRPGRTGIVAVIEMIGAGIVLVDGLFDEALPEHAGVEIHVLAGIGGDRGDVMEAV